MASTASVPGAFSASKYTHISTATTTIIKDGAGYLGTLTINTFVASGTVTVYDNNVGSGTVIAIITNPGTLSFEGPISANYGIGFNTGLTIVTTGAQDITVSWL